MKRRGTKFSGKLSWATAISLNARNIYVVAMLAGVIIVAALVQAQLAQSQQIFENVRIGQNFSPDPMTLRGISGGSVPATQVANRKDTPTGPCVGFVDEQPDHVVELRNFFNYLRLQVQSPEDTTIVISGPGGTWCNDDFQGKNPGVAGQWLAGTYRVWIGSYDKTNFHPYLIKISKAQLLNPGPSRR